MFGGERRFIGGRRFSWLYPLIVTAIALPVLCVVWLLKDAAEKEKEIVAELVAESYARTLDDAESEVLNLLGERLNQTLAIYRENRFSPVLSALKSNSHNFSDGVVYWGIDSYKHQGESNVGGWSVILAGRSLLNGDEALEGRIESVLELLEDAENRSTRQVGGRGAALMLLSLCLDEYPSEVVLPDRLQQHLDSVFEGELEYAVTDSQFSFFVRRYSERASSVKAVSNVEKIRFSNDWVDAVFEGTGMQLSRFISVHENVIAVNHLGEGLSVLFSKERVRELAKKRVPRVHWGLADDGYPDADFAIRRVVADPLAFLSMGLLRDPKIDTIGVGRVRAYLVIGGIVLLLSIVSGIVTVMLMRRQSDAAQLKNDLVATVTHELKTPVASVRLLVDTLLDPNRVGMVDTKEYLELIGRENKRLGYLIDNFLSFSRMERNKSSFDRESIDPMAVAKESKEVFEERFSGRRFTLELRCMETVPPILGDREALTTVLGNLLENALKYGGRNAEITLTLSSGRSGAEFSVADRGIGISRSDQKRIFRKFYQGKRTLSAHAGGVGLGLSIVSFIVSKHGGEVSVSSELETGSCFTITIPYA